MDPHAVLRDPRGAADVDFDVAVVGAGAAGLMAAIFAARGGASTVALDGASRLGAKILISGGGRCNVTHERVSAEDFNASNRNLVAKLLRSFDVPDTVAFFRELGVELKREETGKLFPVSDRAATVLDALVGEARRAGTELRTSSRVLAVCPRGAGFVLETGSGSVIARRVVLATGGRSIPKSGSDGAGYELARALGHSVGETFPALVPLLLEGGHWLMALSGIACDVELSLLGARGKLLKRVGGSMLLTHFGLSGPAVLDMSRHWIAAKREGEATLVASFVPGDDFPSIDGWLVAAGKESPRRTLVALLRANLTERLAESLIREGAEVAPDTPLGRLTREDRRSVAHALTALPLPVTGERGFGFAEVTAGGVPIEEIDLRTMESRVCRGLHLCGEILDVDGRIGGFNFQWAWAS
ncbi:MAG: aminoacetone oxidase family FAD-binding enzyme, partial [Thermoanaerobaculia bacterium]|nr:aminoacetone oxidase family FAD-binding enzyme [Thermoanaerobaculia bacterium]